MKKVILENKKEEVYLSDLNEDSIVGALWDSSINKTAYFRHGSSTFELDNELNKLCIVNEPFYKYFKGCTSLKKVYQFDTMKELFKWLSED